MKVRRIILLLLIGAMQSSSAQWAHTFVKQFSDRELKVGQQANMLQFSKLNIPLYSQLLLSWNAMRPAKGHFTFYVQARNAHSYRWGTWHRMLEWGSDVQRSHATKSDGFTKYVHVRLETEPLQLADAFRIKIVGAKGAPVPFMKNIVITTANMRTFHPEAIEGHLTKLASVAIEKVPKISQFTLKHPENSVMCSPVSCSMISEFVSKKTVNPITFAQNCYDSGLKSYGSWPFNMAHAYEKCNQQGIFYHTRLNSFKELHAKLQKGVPVAVSVRGNLARAPRPYPHGHLMAVIGYDGKNKEVICHDPAHRYDGHVEQRYSLKDFIRSWEASRRLSYIVEPIKRA